jgi:hypothetical protein
MSPEVVITFFGGLFAIGGIILAGLSMHHRYSRQRAGNNQLDRLAEGLEGLHQELGVLQHQVEALETHVRTVEGFLSAPVGPERTRQALPGESERVLAERDRVG